MGRRGEDGRIGSLELPPNQDMPMRPFIPKSLEPYAFGFLLSGFMSLLVSGLATALTIGLVSDFPAAWMRSWISSWIIAFPSVLVVAPIVRRILRLIVIPDSSRSKDD